MIISNKFDINLIKYISRTISYRDEAMKKILVSRKRKVYNEAIVK